MRDIKFRAWDKKQNMMRSIFSLNSKGDPIEIFPERRVNKDLELMQFTGLVDKNGKEIYEGDIFKAQVNWLSKETDELEEHDIFIGQILFCNFEWVFNGIVFAEDGEKINTIQLPFSEYRTGYSWGNGIEKWHSTFTSKERFTEFEVIGNIYENPELINKGDSNG